MSEQPAIAASHRQLKLFHLENPLTVRLGAEFFRALPSVPGVYFFHGSDGQLLYIGQSADLRARIGSYRHVTPEQNPKRTLRLVSKIVRIEWQECATPAEAIERERLLLLEHRPPFNRAGVWQGEPWWLSLRAREALLDLRLDHVPEDQSIGPLPPGFRYSLPTLVRCLLRIDNPGWGLHEFPCGLMGGRAFLEVSVAVSDPTRLQDRLVAACDGRVEELLTALDAIPPPATVMEREFWEEERKRLSKQTPASKPAENSGQ